MKRIKRTTIAIFLVPVFAVLVLGYASLISIRDAITRPVMDLSDISNNSISTSVKVIQNVTGADDAQATSMVVTILSAASLTAKIQWAVPELRVGSAETNDDTSFYLAVYSSAEDGSPALFTMSGLATTATDGTYLTQIPLGALAAGTYDVIFKGHQSLAKKLNDITLNGVTTLNFTTLDNSAPKGSEVLLGGDISNDGTLPSNLGDNVVNSVDFSILLDDLDGTDGTGNGVRANINQDTAINSVDMSILLKNLDVNGDES